MSEFAILADVTCDLDAELQEKYNIHVIPGHMTLPDKREMETLPEWTLFTREEFYTDLKKRPNEYTTSPPNVQAFTDVFTQYAAKGCPVIVLTISGGMSGTFNFATQAKKAALAQYPDAVIHCVDSLRFGPGLGLMAMYASMKRAEGKTIEETVEWLESNKNRFHQAGWLDDLSFVAKKGRLTHAKAFFGALAGVKPLGEFDYNGLTTVIGKARGAKAAYAALLSYIEETIEDAEDQVIVIAQTNRLPQAEEYKRLIEEKFHPKEVLIRDVYPSCGINIGPGLMAAYYIGEPISEGLEKERAIMEKYLGA
ncbi:MAG: DegV family protein [Clostridia bacterium]|nr:DegV family protein [Clostridia bacterium]